MSDHALAGTVGSVGAGRRSARQIGVVAAVLACLSVLALGIFATGARAATTTDSYGYLASFGSIDPFQESILQHNAVAIDGAGNIFTPQDTPGVGVGVYAPDPSLGGTSLTTISTATAAAEGGLALATDVAVDPASGAVYFLAAGGGVFRFVSDGQPTPTYTQDLNFAPPPFGSSTGSGTLVVDPTTHDILVAEVGSSTIRKLDPSGALVGSIAVGSGISVLTVGQAGTIYVLDGNGVEHFATDGTKLPALPLPAGFAPSLIAANTQTGEVVVLDTSNGQDYLQGFSAAGTPIFSTRLRTDMFTLSAELPHRGLAWDPLTDRIYYATGFGAVHTFVPGLAPGLDTPVASNVTPTTADLSAGLAPAGSTKARFEICPDSPTVNPCANYLVSAPSPPDPAADPANPWQRLSEQEGVSGPSLEDTATNLLPNTTYQVRAVALNTTAGTEATSEIGSFHTPLAPPLVRTGAATAITESSAVLTGSIDNTFGDPTNFHFEYGLTTNYGSRMPALSESLGGASREPRAFSRSIAGLQPGTTYHYRIVAANSAGSANGADQTFTTLGVDEVAPGRGYEQVSPVDKGGAVILNLTQFSIAPDGSSMVIPVSAAPPDATGVMIFQHYVVHRKADGWADWKQTDPPQNTERGTFETSTLGISEDYQHAFVVSNRALAPGGVGGQANLYVFDIAEGAYTFVATSAAEGAFGAFAGLQDNQTRFEGGAPDFSWVIFQSPVPLLDGGPDTGLYKWSQSGGLTLLSQMPGNAPATEPVWAQSNGILSSRRSSADGATAYFGLRGSGAGAGGIFRSADGETTAISVTHASDGLPTGIQPGYLDGVSANGRYAVFRSQSKLTNDATDLTGRSTTNIYRYDSSDDSLRYLAAGADGEVGVYAVSDDARTVLYQTDSGGGLTVWRDGSVQTIDSAPVPTNRALLSPNGRFVGYRTASSPGSEYATAYVYDTQTQQRACASCSPTTGTGGDQAYTNFDARGFSNFAPQIVTDNGIMFFDTPDALVPADHNSARDVYAFQHGQLTLISPGDGDYQAHFMSASNEGRDVFFTTSESLVGQDTDRSVDVYDARVGGGFAGQNPPPPPASCVRAGCGEPGVRTITASVASSETPRPDGSTVSKISIGKVSITSKAIKIEFKAPYGGRLTASGPMVVRSQKKLAKAGTYRINVPLSKKARSMIRANERLKLTVKLTLAGAGSTTSSTLTRTIGR